ncbi:short-chain dehydrogenase [Vulcanimicrobium alpinum]|uniref:Short-chain dehydrogenase n=1 Tax=Vulcanimicrobium alpinum TaxID=3016050 RepID=A0AAN1XY49_UNVUL|nr:short-chain dehydrogenase [Vulcanimicrobium alpinum]
MGRFSGTAVLVTGGSTGIGFAAADKFGKEGARVAITGRDPDRLRAAASRLASGTVAIQSDSADVNATRLLGDTVGRQFGKLDAVFINAGIVRLATIEAVSEELIDEVFSVNVKGAIFTIQALLPFLQPGSSVIVNTSVNNRIGMAGTLVYAASKAALRSVVRVAAGELAERGIRVNAVSPGPVDTPIYDTLGLSAEALQAFAASIVPKIPLGRFAKAEEIAQVVLFLASADSSFITGAEIVADGGWTGVTR